MGQMVPADDAGDYGEKQFALAKVIEWFTDVNPAKIEAYVDKLQSQNSTLSNLQLSKKIVSRRSLKNGFVGAATGVGGLLTLPIAVPADLIASWRIQVFTACSVAYIYGHTSETTDLKTDMYLILAGDSAKEALKRTGIEVGKRVTKKAVQRYVTREVMKKIWRIAGQKVITKAGQKSLTSFMKMVPLIGAPIGFGFDYATARGVGHFAIRYYSGQA